MYATVASVAVAAALAALPGVSAHGYVQGVKTSNNYFHVAGPNWIYETPVNDPGWMAYNQDNGFVAPSEYGDQNITCHKGATPGNGYITAAAGSTIDLQWTDWPDSHHGPVLSYLARCPNADCTKVNKADLKFFKIDAVGLINDNSEPGYWAADKLIANNNTWSLKLPSDLSGAFVLRHEIIALHSAGQVDGAQNYPMCLNLKITGSGNTMPCNSGAKCVAGTGLYNENSKSIVVNIYGALSGYAIPGPALWSGLKKRVAQAFSA